MCSCKLWATRPNLTNPFFLRQWIGDFFLSLLLYPLLYFFSNSVFRKQNGFKNSIKDKKEGEKRKRASIYEYFCLIQKFEQESLEFGDWIFSLAAVRSPSRPASRFIKNLNLGAAKNCPPDKNICLLGTKIGFYTKRLSVSVGQSLKENLGFKLASRNKCSAFCVDGASPKNTNLKRVGNKLLSFHRLILFSKWKSTSIRDSPLEHDIAAIFFRIAGVTP